MEAPGFVFYYKNYAVICTNTALKYYSYIK